MKKTVLALTFAALAVPAFAQDKKAPEPDYTFGGNFGLTSDYRFRGISQSNTSPAVQGGLDFTHKSGLYLGNWNSSISQWTAPNGGGTEMDFYAGLKKEIAGVGFDLGTIYYYYPGAQWGTDLIKPAAATVTKNYWNTHEVYVGLGYGPLSFKTSYTLSDRYFGIGKENDTSLQTAADSSSKGTLYYDLTFAYEIASKTTLKIHAGFLNLNKKEAALDVIKDYSVGLAYDLDGWLFSVSYVTTSGLSADGKAFFTTTDGRNKKLYEGVGVVSLTKTF